MTNKGSFVINGAERVIVSQLHRSPGVFFAQSKHTNGTPLYSARIIPFRGSWIEFATDVNNVMYAYIDRKKKFPITTLLRAIGYGSDKDILDIAYTMIFKGENPILLPSDEFASNNVKNYFKDHRIFMTSVIAAYTFGGKWEINDIDSYKSSFPSFLNIIKKYFYFHFYFF